MASIGAEWGHFEVRWIQLRRNGEHFEERGIQLGWYGALRGTMESIRAEWGALGERQGPLGETEKYGNYQ